MSDKRFEALSNDPRYRLPSRKQAQTAVDPRFKALFQDEGFRKKASVDRYGRKLKPDSGKEEIEKRFRLEDDGEPEAKAKPKKAQQKEVVGSSDESEEESDEDNEQAVRDPAREGGFSESSSEESTSEEDESDDELDLAEDTAGREQTEDVPMGEVSRRIAAVNLDWDNLRATDILAVGSSFVPTSGRIEQVTVYPSEFGRERLEREELEGPPKEIFASSKKQEAPSDESEIEDSEEENAKIRKRLQQTQADDGTEFDTGKLRQYQLERLRYYYAVIECDTPGTAKSLYDAMDGREYLTTANFFDLRFVPDSVSFDDDTPRDVAKKLPEGYKPNDFRTEALTHSKVRLTWDDDDTTRKEVQKRAFSRAELDENDLQAYIGSDSSGDDSTSSRKSSAEDRKAKKREAERAKMRSALGLASEPSKDKKVKDKDEPVGDMQITFSAGLTGSNKDKGVFENEPQDEESTRDRYIRKERERKQKRKERSKSGRAGGAEEEEKEDDKPAAEAPQVTTGAEDDPFNDPFFNDPATAAAAEKSARKADKAKKRSERDAADAEAASRRAELELLMADEDGEGKGVQHFDMREIEKAEKEARRKGKKGKKGAKKDAGEVKDEFKVEAEDPRFNALFENHEYAIDPTNPRFKGTEGMKTLLEEGRKKRKRGEDRGEEDGAGAVKAKKGKGAKKEGEGDEDLSGLVARLKKKDGKKPK